MFIWTYLKQRENRIYLKQQDFWGPEARRYQYLNEPRVHEKLSQGIPWHKPYLKGVCVCISTYGGQTVDNKLEEGRKVNSNYNNNNNNNNDIFNNNNNAI